VGGGKSYAIIWESILRCLKYDFPVTGAIFRRSYPELDATIIRTIRQILPAYFYKYNQAQHIMKLATGDIIEFCYAENDGDVYRYQSREWDFLGIDEVTHFTEYQYTYLLTRLRTTKPLKPKFFAATNPGNIGHAWVKSRWITKDCEAPGYNADDYDFIPAGIRDNPYLMKNNPKYIETLENLPQDERRALLDGDWDVFKGQFFKEFSQDKHVVEAFEVPQGWRLIMGWDDGTRAPRSVQIFAIDNDQRVWCIWEYYKAGETLVDAARNIKKELEELKLWNRVFKCVVDPSMTRKSSQTGMSSVDVLNGMGFGFQVGEIELGNNDRIEGWRLVKSYLSHKPYEEPMLKIFNTCANLVRTLPQMIYYQTKAGDAKKDDLDTKIEDHAVDSLRYVLMSLENLPTRFSSGEAFKIAKSSYVPNSTVRNI